MTEHMWDRSYVPGIADNPWVRQGMCSCGWRGPMRGYLRDEERVPHCGTLDDFLKHLAVHGYPEPLKAYLAQR